MKRLKLTLVVATVIWTVALSSVQAEVKHRQINPQNLIVDVSNESWQPEGFENGTVIPATYLSGGEIVIDGKDNEPVWKQAAEIEVPLSYGSAKKAFLKAVYTDQEVIIRVRWADDDEDRQHHPWVWSPEQKTYVAGSQVEDSVLLSFEAGCDWNPSFLTGYVFDFDAWHWLAARSDPLGQALDLYGNVQDQNMKNQNFTRYQSRNTQDIWNLKFIENTNVDLYAKWNDLDRVYMLQPVTRTLYFQGVTDGSNPPPFVRQVAAPSGIPYPRDEAKTIPQYSPVKLKDGAGEVTAKGQWKNGYWTVEFRRNRITPAKTLNDVVFNRLTQFSVYVFDRTEKIDQASESKRLFLQFLPGDQKVVSK
jgi:hypothetical protein